MGRRVEGRRNGARERTLLGSILGKRNPFVVLCGERILGGLGVGVQSHQLVVEGTDALLHVLLKDALDRRERLVCRGCFL